MERYVLTVEKLIPGGLGLCRHEGRVVMVPDVVDGEVVEVEVVARHSDYDEGVLVGVREGAAARVAPRCGYYGVCGGCALQHVAYDHQVEVKRGWLEEHLRRAGVGEVPECEVYAGSAYGYRSRVQVQVEGGRPGFLGRDLTHVAVEGCAVAHPACGPAFRREYRIERGKVPFVGWEGRLWGGEEPEEFCVEVGGYVFHGRTDLFFQSNLFGLERLLGWLEGVVPAGDGGEAWDLYAGVGVFSQVLARRGWRPRLVESAVASLGYAEQALGGGAAYVGVSAERFLRGYRGVVPGMVVADPPRGGLSRTVRAFFEGQGVPLLVYISCNTATFARDVAHLVWAGYRLTRLAFFDFYPQTPHMEVAGVLSK
ncbi:(Uracil-5)-methyltransferase [Spirochaeta thermophila DSM 6578]|uniref:(Uracil-5)-methyltransferase n=1 Tax=Winmispira thermophila (strain ATCC 700085 / DSM 6578 / Z-1203) TaxID=869211 RepID=G0GCG0_WINT7|nr:class I SAM-dependent RNA methyltransferase [Spirochaeta thermophila]AEJ62026.1 (Uracil-5)-methyltransferase [Spirochaeta thermophila DSM 6578]